MPGQFKLPPEKVAELQADQRRLHDILDELSKAEECGVDCSEYRRLREEVLDRNQKILKNYG